MNIVVWRFRKGAAGLNEFFAKSAAFDFRLSNVAISEERSHQSGFNTQQRTGCRTRRFRAFSALFRALSYAPKPSEISHLPSRAGHCWMSG